MGWTDVSTAIPGTVYTAARRNTEVRDNFATVRAELDALASVLARCNAYNSAAQTVSAGATDALTLDTEDEDVGGLHSTSLNTNRMTIVVAGVYLAIARTQVESAGAASARLYLRVDGAAKAAAKVDAPGATLPSYSLEVSGVFALTAGQYVDMVGEAVSANCQFGSASAAWASRLIVARIA